MSGFKSRKGVLAALVAAALLLAGCTPGTANPSDAGGADQVLRFGITAPDIVTGFDPSRAPGPDLDIDRYLYSYLIRVDRSDPTKYVPDLAKSWESSTDGLTWTFHLRDDANFTDGYGKVTSDDVLFTFEHLKDAAGGSIFGTDVANISSVTAPDAQTVVFQLAQPDPNFLYRIADTGSCYAGILSRKAVTALGKDYPFKPVGSGPFTLGSYTSHDRVVLARNDGYYGDKYNLKEIDFIFMPDNTSRITAFQNGDLDIAQVQTDAKLVQSLEDAGDAMLPSEPEVVPIYLNTSKAPFNDLRVRQAMAYAIDVKALNDYFSPLYKYTAPMRMWQDNMSGFAAAANLVPDYTYDPAKAKELLSEAGYPSGLDVTVTMATTDQKSIDAMTLAKEQMKAAGFNISLETSEFGPFQTKLRAGNFVAAVQRISRGIESEIAAQNFVSSSTPDGASPVYNYGYYKNPQVDEWNNEATHELDPAKRAQLYANIIQALMTDLPTIPILWGEPATYAAQPDVDLGYPPTIIDNRYPFIPATAKITG